MDNERMDEMEQNGVADYWISLKDWSREFWMRNYPYNFGKDELSALMNDQVDEMVLLRNRALAIMSEEIEKIVAEQEAKTKDSSESTILKQEPFSISDQEKLIMKMKERIIARLYEEKVAPVDYKNLITQHDKPREEK